MDGRYQGGGNIIINRKEVIGFRWPSIEAEKILANFKQRCIHIGRIVGVSDAVYRGAKDASLQLKGMSFFNYLILIMLKGGMTTRLSVSRSNQRICRWMPLLPVFFGLSTIPVAHAYPNLTNGTYRIFSRNSGQVLSVWAGGTNNGASSVQWPWNGGSDQNWVLQNISGNQYAIISEKVIGKYLDVYGGVGATGDGANVDIWDPPVPGNPASNQKWIIQPTGDNYSTYTLTAVHSGKLLDVSGVSFANGANVQQWTATAGLNQEWYIEPVQLPTPTKLAATSSNGLVTLAWNALPGSARFNIKRSTTNGSGYATIATNVRGTNYYDSMLTSGMTYYYVVATTNIGGESTNSTQASAKPLSSDKPKDRPRVIVTTDGEADDQASMVRFLLTCNEFEVEGIVNTSSQFHWVGGSGWNAFHRFEWVKDFIGRYAQVYNNLLLHDPNYPSPQYLLSRWKVGNIDSVGEYAARTEGAKLIAEVLLDDKDPRPVWIQAWGGCNTIAAALKIIQDDYPARMAEVAAKLRLYLIWEQDESYKNYIYSNWESYNILTIIADTFDCIAYEWPNDLPNSLKASHFNAPWAANNIVNGHGALCAAYVNNGGAFNAEGDTPSFLHTIPNGLRSTESPRYGGWGGRYVNVRNSVWMDSPPAVSGNWAYPDPGAGEWRSIHNSWAKALLNSPYTKTDRKNYFKPIWRWLAAVQNDFAARADWCVMNYESANHPPIVRLKTPLDLNATPGQMVTLDATPTCDPDGDTLNFRWWNYFEAGTYSGTALPESSVPKTTIKIPTDAVPGQEIHMICEVSDTGTPSLTRYQRVVIHVVSH